MAPPPSCYAAAILALYYVAAQHITPAPKSLDSPNHLINCTIFTPTYNIVVPKDISSGEVVKWEKHFLLLLDKVFDLGPDVQRWRQDGAPRFSN